MNYLPIFIAARGQRIVVTGEGPLAEAKCRTVLKSSAQVVLISERPSAAMTAWAAEGLLTLNQRACRASDLEGVRLVYAASERDDINTQVAEWARRSGAWVNVLDRPEQCDFITPAVVDRDPVVVAIGTEGAAPVLARQIKAEVEAMLPQYLGRLARAARAFRSRVAATLLPGLPRRQFWAAVFKPSVLDETLSDAELGKAMEALLVQHRLQAAPEGQVAFVGAGPGDPELLTIKARRLIHEADVVVYDRLVGADILDLARKEATFISVGKAGFGPAVSQSDINAHLVREATSGKAVVRLKGGDPSMFGRLDEELECLAAQDITVLVVPGVTAASAAAATLNVSLTRRGRNSSVTFLTAHDAKGFAEHDWQQLVRTGQALAVYMGRRTATFLQGRMLMHGASAALPVTCIENISRSDQRAFVSNLGAFASELDNRSFNGPLMILIGITGGAVDQCVERMGAGADVGEVALGSA